MSIKTITMKWMPLLLITSALLLSSCANTDSADRGKIGRDYDNDPTVRAARTENMHSDIIRGGF